MISLMMKARYCPQCGSTDVEPDSSNAAAVSGFGGNPNKWRCNECDYTGLMPEGNPENEDEKISSEENESKTYNRVNVTGGSKKSYRLSLLAIAIIFVTLIIIELI